PRHALEQATSTGKHAREHPLDDLAVAHDHLADLGPQALVPSSEFRCSGFDFHVRRSGVQAFRRSGSIRKGSSVTLPALNARTPERTSLSPDPLEVLLH